MNEQEIWQMANERMPVGLAMVVCDAVHQDPLNAKRTILGAVSYLTLESYPFHFDALMVRIALMECLGSYELVHRFSDIASNIMLIEEQIIPFECDNPIDVVEVDLLLRELTIPKSGHYFFLSC